MISCCLTMTAPARVRDLTAQVTAAEIERDLHGDAAMRLDLAMRGLADQFTFYDRGGAQDLEAWELGAAIFRGRLEGVGISSDAGLALHAFGPSRALDDLPYTALWSDDSVAGWRPISTGDIGLRYADRGNFDTQNRIYIAPKSGLIYSWGFAIGQCYQRPHASALALTRVSFHYKLQIDAGVAQPLWVARVIAYDGESSPWSELGVSNFANPSAPGTYTGSATWTAPAGTNVVAFEMYYGSAGAQYTGDDGQVYLEVTNVRVTTATPPITAAHIASHLASEIAATNWTQLQSGAITSGASNDYTRAIWQDASMRAVLDELANRERLEWGVDRQRRLYLRSAELDSPATARTWGRVWRVDISRLELERLVEQLANSTYATYQDASGRTLRTAAASDAMSVERTGYTRRALSRAETTSSALAQTIRDAALADRADPPPRAAITFDRVWTLSGAAARRSDVHPGDVLILGNLSTRLSATIDQVAALRLARTRLTLARGQRAVLEVEPMDPPRTLEVLLARQEAGWL